MKSILKSIAPKKCCKIFTPELSAITSSTSALCALPIVVDLSVMNAITSLGDDASVHFCFTCATTAWCARSALGCAKNRYQRENNRRDLTKMIWFLLSWLVGQSYNDLTSYALLEHRRVVKRNLSQVC